VRRVVAGIQDVSVLVRPGMHLFEGDPRVSLVPVLSIADGAVANVGELCCGTHTGTHVDAPNHFIEGAGGVETIDVDALCGPALVVDLRGVERSIDAEVLARVDLEDVTRVSTNTLFGLFGMLDVASEMGLDRPDAAELLVAAESGSSGSTTCRWGRRDRILLGAGWSSGGLD
jgi:hypothetical protein